MVGPTKILIVIGLDRLFREIVETALAKHGWNAIDPEQSPAQIKRNIDVALVFSSGSTEMVVGTVERVTASWPGIKVVLLGAPNSDKEVIRFIEAGVGACVTGNQKLTELVNTLQMVCNDQATASGRVTQLVLRDINRLTRQRVASPETRLTAREKEILRLVGSGLSNKEIAHNLRISLNTVKNHVHHMLEKLQVRSRHEASWLQSRMPRGFPLAGTSTSCRGPIVQLGLSAT